jgi:hypothetical protein
MMSPGFNRDARFVIIYFDRFYEIEACGGVSSKLDLLIQDTLGHVVYWFTNKTGQVVTDMEQFIYDVLRRNV